MSINYSNSISCSCLWLSFNPKKAPAWTPCPDHSNHPGSEMSLSHTMVQEIFKKLRGNVALKADSCILGTLGIIWC